MNTNSIEIEEGIGTITISESLREATLSDQYRVYLHNDDHNSMVYVVEILMKVFKLEEQRAAQIMLAAHKNGFALCTVEPLERAELHRDLLQSYSLLSSIEKE
jgi:ATP-dependent Clp protease adaptor protein ClpS